MTTQPKGKRHGIHRHGFISTYRRGCRCDECRRANRRTTRRYRDSHREVWLITDFPVFLFNRDLDDETVIDMMDRMP